MAMPRGGRRRRQSMGQRASYAWGTRHQQRRRVRAQLEIFTSCLCLPAEPLGDAMRRFYTMPHHFDCNDYSIMIAIASTAQKQHSKVSCKRVHLTKQLVMACATVIVVIVQRMILRSCVCKRMICVGKGLACVECQPLLLQPAAPHHAHTWSLPPDTSHVASATSEYPLSQQCSHKAC